MVLDYLMDFHTQNHCYIKVHGSTLNAECFTNKIKGKVLWSDISLKSDLTPLNAISLCHLKHIPIPEYFWIAWLHVPPGKVKASGL